MQKQKSRTNSTSAPSETVRSAVHIGVDMPNDVLHKIQYLCRAMPREEWSGILLYSVHGSIREPERMAITLRDIIPMHRGDAVSTEYAFNGNGRDRHADYVAANPHALGWRVGHVHSHNCMDVFFSGTDMDELVGNAAAHDFYLSLIANNWCEFAAKVAVRSTCTLRGEEIYMATDEEGRPYVVQSEEVERTLCRTHVHDCLIRYQRPEIPEVDRVFARAVEEVVAEKAPLAGAQLPLWPQAPAVAGHQPSHGDVAAFVADLFASAAEACGVPVPQGSVRLADALALAAEAGPGRIADFVGTFYDAVFKDHFGKDIDIGPYRATMGEAVFILENHESDHPQMLAPIVDLLEEWSAQNGNGGRQ